MGDISPEEQEMVDMMNDNPGQSMVNLDGKYEIEDQKYIIS